MNDQEKQIIVVFIILIAILGLGGYFAFSTGPGEAFLASLGGAFMVLDNSIDPLVCQQIVNIDQQPNVVRFNNQYYIDTCISDRELLSYECSNGLPTDVIFSCSCHAGRCLNS